MLSASTDRFNGILEGLAIKAPCVTVALVNITLSGEQTVNSIAVVANDRVLVTAQTAGKDNGIYKVSTSAWTREPDFDGNRDIVEGTQVAVNDDGGIGAFYEVTTANPITIGQTAITFQVTTRVGPAGPAGPVGFFALTATESDAGLTTTDIKDQFDPEPFAEIERYHKGTIGASVDDDNAVDVAITIIKQGGWLAVIPPTFDSAMVTPELGLANDESGVLMDLRIDRPNVGDDAFGALDLTIEGRDSNGNYASEFRIKGKQNPAFTAVSLSDGTANGFPRVNFASSFLHKAGAVDLWQYISDPLFGGYQSWEMVYFDGGSGKIAVHIALDNNGKPRFTYVPQNLTSASGNVSGATNATPIVITTDAPHGLAGTNQPVSISSVGGNTAANGSWEVSVLTSTTFELNGSVGDGAYTSGGTWAGEKNNSRATLNVPKIQGGTEAILVEGSIASELATGDAPLTTLSKTVDVNLHARPYIVDLAGVHQVSGTPGSGVARHVIGSVDLVAGAATINLTNDASFTDNAKYQVFLQPQAGASAATPTKVNGGQFTIAGTGTDTISYHALGY